MLLFAGFNFPYAKTNPVTAFVTMSFSSFRRRAMYFITSSSSGTSINILPSPVRSQVSFTLNSLHIKEKTESIGAFLPISYCAIVFPLTPIRSPNSFCVKSKAFLSFFSRSFIKELTSFLVANYTVKVPYRQYKTSQKQKKSQKQKLILTKMYLRSNIFT